MPGPARSEPQIANLSEHLIIQRSFSMENRSETSRSPPDTTQAQLSGSLTTSYENPCPPNSARINDLPNEILAQILLFCLINIDETIWDDLRFGMVPLRRLRIVCTRWNDTILAEPTFWTCIDITVESSFSVGTKLRRSGALPLTIKYFNLEGITDEGRENPEFHGIADLVGSHAHRWKSISLWALNHELEQLTQYLEHPPRGLLELEYLNIRRNAADTDNLAWVLGEAAKLQRLVLDGYALPWNSSELRYLVHIEIQGRIEYLDLLVHVIRASQSLETLKLTDTIFNDDDVEDQQRVGWPDERHPSVLPRLRHIEIRGFESPAAVACVLRCIRAPNITRLRMLEVYVGGGQAGVEITQALISYHGTESILTSILHRASSFAELELRCSQNTLFLELCGRYEGLYCRLGLSLLHPDWTESAVLVAEVVRLTGIRVLLKFGRQPHAVIPTFFLLFPMLNTF
ncbi:hypothetical protein FS837_000497 [Tulasnella sp. UAMH 9824]|nr:hypothetical protein FS837_000497 [Tulasnella sp. UAMH 9824]